MAQFERNINKIDECISKFNNGIERYNESPIFNSVVQLLVRGSDPYQVIDNLCQMIDDNQKEFEKYINTNIQTIINPMK